MQWLHILHLPHFNFFRHFLFMFYIAETYNTTKELVIEDCLKQSYIIHETISKYLFFLFKKFPISFSKRDELYDIYIFEPLIYVSSSYMIKKENAWKTFWKILDKNISLFHMKMKSNVFIFCHVVSNVKGNKSCQTKSKQLNKYKYRSYIHIKIANSFCYFKVCK